LLRGEELINEALEIAPEYAPGWVLKASIHSQQADVGARLPVEAAPMARAAVDRALELDPFNIDALYQAGVYYAFIGRPEEALPLSLAARERDPLFTANHSVLAYIYNMLGRYDEAFEICQERARIAPESYGTYAYAANPLIAQGRYEEAIEWAKQERLDGFKQTSLAIIHWQLGNREKSDAALAALIAQQSDGWDWQVVQVHAVRGEIDKAFAAMDAAFENRDSGLQLLIGDMHVENLRGDPRYDAMVRKIGIPVD
jgi:tetratricopeptide (TPR) repeat protein